MKKFFQTIVLSALMIMFVFWGYSFSEVSFKKIKTFEVDTHVSYLRNNYYPNHHSYKTGIVVDQNGDLHLAYNDGFDLHYAFYNNHANEWLYSKVDTRPIAYQLPTLLLSENGIYILANERDVTQVWRSVSNCSLYFRENKPGASWKKLTDVYQNREYENKGPAHIAEFMSFDPMNNIHIFMFNRGWYSNGDAVYEHVFNTSSTTLGPEVLVSNRRGNDPDISRNYIIHGSVFHQNNGDMIIPHFDRVDKAVFFSTASSPYETWSSSDNIYSYEDLSVMSIAQDQEKHYHILYYDYQSYNFYYSYDWSTPELISDQVFHDNADISICRDRIYVLLSEKKTESKISIGNLFITCKVNKPDTQWSKPIQISHETQYQEVSSGNKIFLSDYWLASSTQTYENNNELYIYYTANDGTPDGNYYNNAHIHILQLENDFITIPSDINHWNRIECGNWQDSEEGLKFFGTTHRRGNSIRTKDSYNFQDSEIFIKWKPDGNNAYMIMNFSVNKFRFANNLSTDHSYNGTTLIGQNTWYYSYIIIEENKFVSIIAIDDYITNNGIEVYRLEKVLNDSEYAKLKDACIYFQFSDNYGGTSSNITIGDIRTSGVPIKKVPSKLIDFENGNIPENLEFSGELSLDQGYNSEYAIYIKSTGNHKLRIPISDYSAVSFDGRMISDYYNVIFSSELNTSDMDSTNSGCWNQYMLPLLQTESYIEWDIKNDVELWIDNITLYKNQENDFSLTINNSQAFGVNDITVPIELTNPNHIDIQGIYQIIAFDSSKLTITDIQLDEKMSSDNYRLDYNIPSPGKLVLSIFASDDLISYSGTIAHVMINILEQGCYSTGLSYSSSEINEQPTGGIDGFIQVRQLPIVEQVVDQTIIEDSDTLSIPITLTYCNDDQINISVLSNNTDLFSNENIQIQGAGTYRTVMVKPEANQSGEATITLAISNAYNQTITSSFNIKVIEVNDPPTFTIGQDIEVYANSDQQMISSWILDMNFGEQSQSCKEFHISVDNENLFAIQPYVSCDGTLTYTPAPNKIGQASIRIELQDDGGTMNSGEDISESQFFTILISGNQISGKLSYFHENKPIQNVYLTLSGNQTYTTFSKTDGSYTFTNVLPGEYVLIPTKTDDLGGLSNTDASYIALFVIQKHDLNCFQKIAADVTQNGLIRPTDASDVSRSALKSTEASIVSRAAISGNNYHCLNNDCINWIFILDNIDPCSRTNAKSYESVINVNSNKSNVNFIGIRLGDVTGNWDVD